MPLTIDAKTKLFAIFADPVEHSASPAIYNAAFERLELNCCYMAFPVNLDKLPAAMESVRALGILGGNFSMPCKKAAKEYMDTLSPAAEMVGVVNTFFVRGGVLEGHCTDGVGFFDYLRSRGVGIAGKQLLLAGIGGVGLAIAAQAALDGARKIVIFNRKDAFWQDGEELVERIRATGVEVSLQDLGDTERLADEIKRADILTNATNVGMGQLEGQSLILPELLYPGLVVVDCIYSPARTRLLRDAEAAGCQIMNGDGMLLRQAATNFGIWTGQQLPASLMR